MTKSDLNEVLRLHGMWIRKEPEGVRANLSEADLRWAYLSKANLSRANLSRANLSEADLFGADLRGADLSGACLRGAYLSKANLSRANLSNANLSGANLFGADLRGADLSGACLRGADLRDANLSRANLSGADLSEADLRWANIKDAILPPLPVTLPPGDFIGWKKVRGDVILELRIFESSKRTGNLVGRKCRADQVLVLSAQRPDGTIIKGRKTFQSMRDLKFIYTVGDLVEEHSFSDDIRVECERGIHFFLSREEAVEY